MKKQLSCIDCAVKSCQRGDGRYPDFCVTTHLDPQTLKDALNCYEEEENHRATLAAIFREHGSRCSASAARPAPCPRLTWGSMRNAAPSAKPPAIPSCRPKS